MKQHFIKTYQNPSELVHLLRTRGLVINDEHRAEHYIRNIGYYRLSAYMHPFLRQPKTLHIFKFGTNFQQILNVYEFDQELRVLLFKEIAKIEIALRETVMNLVAEQTGDIYWLTNPVHYHSLPIFHQSMDFLRKEYEHSTEKFIEHFRHNYLEPFPPAWILGELLSMGNVNKYYRNLKNKNLKKQIARRFHLHAPVFESWFSILTLTRNACCHHARIWNKVNNIIPNDMRGMSQPWITIPTDKHRIYFNLCIIKYFLNIISPENDMFDKLQDLLGRFPEIDVRAMGFTEGWKEEKVWAAL